jgi:membrane protein
MDNLPEQQDNQAQLVREILEYQKLELANKREELALRRHEIQSNENIALAAISAQKENNTQGSEVLIAVNKSRLVIWVVVAFLLAAVLVFAMFTDSKEIALELIKIGGAVALGYFAGVNRGKAQVLEKQKRDDE